MKYLHSRDNYLKNINERRIIQQEKMLEDLTSKLILEENSPGSGAFGNNVRWGDSLLGRFINFISRKIGVGIDMGRISIVAKQLKGQFDKLLTDSVISSLSQEEQVDLAIVQISTLLGVLKKAVDDGEKVGKIRDITESTISSVEELDVIDETKKSKVLEALNKFLEFLKQFKDSEGQGGPLSNEDDEDEDKDEKEESGGVTFGKSYPTMIKNLQSLSSILVNYKKLDFEENIKKSKKIIYVTVKDDTLKKIEVSPKNIKKLKAKDIIAKNQMVNHNGQKKKFSDYFEEGKDKTMQLLPAGIELTLESLSYLFEAGPVAGSNKQGSTQPIGSGAGTQRNVITKGEDHVTQAFNKLKKSCEILQDKTKGSGVTVEFLNSIISMKNDEESKTQIKLLYKDILRYLIGDLKSTLNAPTDPLYENIEILSKKATRQPFAEKIARFSVRALQFDGENLYGELGELGNPLKDFVNSLKELKKINPSELKTESKLLSYNGFRLILEAEGDSNPEEENKEEGDEKESEESTNDVSQQIKDEFQKILVDFDDYLLTDEQVKKITQKVEDVEQKQGKSITISGMNPIIEIVRLFNRAYKLHTTDVIPGNRSEGKVDRMTYNEYTAFGRSSGEPSATQDGPYRHKKTFNIWENAVMDILADTKYAPVFAKETKIDDGAGNIKEGGGVALRRLMLDLLDGDDLYKSGSSGTSAGSQKRALNEYFGEVATTFFDTKPDVSLGLRDKKTGKNDLEEIEPIANEITTSKLKFLRSSSLNNDVVIKENKYKWTVLQIYGKDDKNDAVAYYCFVREAANGMYYLMISRTFYYIKKIIESEYPSTNVEKGDSPNLELRDKYTGGPYPIYHTKVTQRLLQNLGGGRASSFEINGIWKDKGNPVKQSKKIKVTGANWLVSEGEDKKSKILKLTDENLLNESIKSISEGGQKSAFFKIREVVDKKYDNFTAESK